MILLQKLWRVQVSNCIYSDNRLIINNNNNNNNIIYIINIKIIILVIINYLNTKWYYYV
jgi:hypothetical protein